MALLTHRQRLLAESDGAGAPLTPRSLPLPQLGKRLLSYRNAHRTEGALRNAIMEEKDLIKSMQQLTRQRQKASGVFTKWAGEQPEQIQALLSGVSFQETRKSNAEDRSDGRVAFRPSAIPPAL